MTTTLKLTDNQVQAIWYALNVADENFRNYDDIEAKELGHRSKARAFDQIREKLEKEGWQ